jgi:hypothetical protein
MMKKACGMRTRWNPESEHGSIIKTRSLSNIRLIYCANEITAHISSIFRYIVMLCASKLRKPSLALPPGSPRLLKSDRLLVMIMVRKQIGTRENPS